jgi:hypothetical protein
MLPRMSLTRLDRRLRRRTTIMPLEESLVIGEVFNRNITARYRLALGSPMATVYFDVYRKGKPVATYEWKIEDPFW